MAANSTSDDADPLPLPESLPESSPESSLEGAPGQTIERAAAVVGVDAAQAARTRRMEKILEILTAVLLSVATLATSWSGYQAGRWGGVQSTLYSQAAAKRVESTRATTAAGQTRLIDLVTFTEWLQAFTTDNTELADFYQTRFRAEFLPAFNAWVASKPRHNPAALSSPFAQPEYVLSLDQEAERLEAEASATFVEGQKANQQSDDYVLNTVLLASVLFFSAISQRFTILPIRVTMLALASLVCILGLFHVVTYPIY